jgi:hypothetical protein
MSKEAMKLALEALQDAVLDYSMGKGAVMRHTEAIKALEEALAKQEQPTVRTGKCLRVGVCASEGHKIQAKQEQGEPVAWRAPNWSHSADDYVYRDFDDPVIGADGKPSPNNEPLYTTPYVPTGRQQRKPLTYEQMNALWFDTNKQHGSVIWRFARAIEAAHGIKE